MRARAQGRTKGNKTVMVAGGEAEETNLTHMRSSHFVDGDTEHGSDEGAGDTSTVIEGTVPVYRSQVVTDKLIRIIDPRADEMSSPTGRFRGPTDVTSVRANRVAGIVYGSRFLT